MHRTTYWTTDDGDIIRVAVACLDDVWECHCEVTEDVGPFDDPLEVLEQAMATAHHLSGYGAHQLELGLG